MSSGNGRTFDESGALVDPTPGGAVVRIGRLDTLASVRRELGRLYRVARKNAGGNVDAATAAKLGYLLNCIGRSLEASEIVRRLEALEQSIGAKR